MSYTEIHFHLLPGIDDGPATLADSVALAAAAAAEGTRTIVATPHVHPSHVQDPSILPELVGEVAAALEAEAIPVQVRCGGELAHHMVSRLSDAQLDLIAHGPPEARWLLLEAALSGVDETFTEAADELRARGFGVVMAHPERALRHAPAGWEVIEHELAAGSAVQVNAWSLAGYYGDRVRDEAFAILRAAPVAAVASDAHGRQRMPSLQLAYAALAEAGDAEPGRRMGAVPETLLERGLPERRAAAA